jgi:hypothetical protein
VSDFVSILRLTFLMLFQTSGQTVLPFGHAEQSEECRKEAKTSISGGQSGDG